MNHQPKGRLPSNPTRRISSGGALLGRINRQLYAGQKGVLACGPPRQREARPGLNLPRPFSRAAGAEDGGIVLTSKRIVGPQFHFDRGLPPL